jgi:hypothetical protein
MFSDIISLLRCPGGHKYAKSFGMQEQEHRLCDVPDCPNALIIPRQLEIVKVKTFNERLLTHTRSNPGKTAGIH